MMQVLRLAVVGWALLALGTVAGNAQSFISNAAIPSGFGLSGNTLGVALSGAYDNARPAGEHLDASTSLAFGVGDPVDGIGVQLGVNFTSFRRFAASGYGAITIHRIFQTGTEGVYSVALSATYLAPWGDSAGQQIGGSIVGSYMFGVNGRLAIATLGLANDLNTARRIEPILGLGLQVAENISVSAGYVGNQSVIGAGWRPAALGGVAITLSLRSLEDPARRSVGFDVTYALSLRN